MAIFTPPRDRPARVIRSGDPNQRDPVDEIDGLAPNMGEDVLPHVVTFQGILRNVARTYYVSDEAMLHSWENARFMRNDPGIMECLEQRQRSTALLGWHLEAENEKDPTEQMLVREMTGLLNLIPHFLKYRENLLYALWYGKYGIQHRYRWRSVIRGINLKNLPPESPLDVPEEHVILAVGPSLSKRQLVAWAAAYGSKLSPTDTKASMIRDFAVFSRSLHVGYNQTRF